MRNSFVDDGSALGLAFALKASVKSYIWTVGKNCVSSLL